MTIAGYWDWIVRVRGRWFAAILLALALTACAVGQAEEHDRGHDDQREVILLAHREGQQVVLVDTETLETLGVLAFPAHVERAGVTTDGRTLLVHMNRLVSCRELRAVDLATLTLSAVVEWPSLSHVVTGDGDYAVTQRGNVGVEVKDGATFDHITTIDAPGVYALYPAPAGRWIIGLNNFRGRTVAIFDMDAHDYVREFPRRETVRAGFWIGDRFVLVGHDDAGHALWSLDMDAESMDDAERMPLQLPPEQAHDFPLVNAVTTEEWLFVHNYVSWRSKIQADDSVPRGIFAVALEDGRSRHLQPDTAFANIVTVQDGHALVGLDMGGRMASPRLLRLDPDSGDVIGERELDRGTCSLAVATVPEHLVPVSRVEILVHTDK